jgi:hypothetical protein
VQVKRKTNAPLQKKQDSPLLLQHKPKYYASEATRQNCPKKQRNTKF